MADGLPVSAVTALGKLVGRARIEGRVSSEATLHRRRKSGRALSRSHSERVYGLARVLDAVGTAFHGDVPRIHDFLARPHPLLGGERRSAILIVPRSWCGWSATSSSMHVTRSAGG